MPRRVETDEETLARMAEQERAQQDRQARQQVLAEQGEAIYTAPAIPPATDAEAERAAAEAYQREMRELKRQKAAELVAHADHASGRRPSLPPVSAMHRYRRMDPSATPKDAEGREYGTPGYPKVWVRPEDADGKPFPYKVDQRLNQGYVIVRDADGKPIEGPFGVLLEIDPREKARREIAYAPAGAVSPSDFFAAEAEAEAEEANRAHKQRVLSMQRTNEHRSYRDHDSPDMDD